MIDGFRRRTMKVRYYRKKKIRGGWRAKVRFWFCVRVLGHESELCYECGGRYPKGVDVWWCESLALWTEVTGWGANGLLCPPCFTKIARRKGIHLLWHPAVHFRAENLSVGGNPQ